MFLGYERETGAAGIRNHVGVMSMLDVANPVVRAICNSVGGTIPITTLFVRGQYGRDLDITYRTLAGLASNPNLHSVLLVGLETTSTGIVTEMIERAGKRVETVVLQEVGGTIEATTQGIRKAARMAVEASRQRRVELPLSHLCIGVECGGSDGTSGLSANPMIGVVADRIVAAGGRVVISETAEFLGAEDVFAARAVNEEVRSAFLDRILSHERDAMARGIDIRGTNPVPDNIRGGLTTIEEKALGAMAKAGSTPLVGVLDYAEVPVAAGMHFMDTPAPAVESMTGLAAGGCQMILFATGAGNTIGSMVAPTVKITGNVNTARHLADDIDVDISSVLSADGDVRAVGDALFDSVLGIASGTVTRSEVLDQRETAISRFDRTI